MHNKNLTLTQRILPVILALFILLSYYIYKGQVDEFYPWLGETLIVYASWFFFMRVIVKTIIDREFDTSFTLPMLIGAFALTISIILFNMTPEDIFLKLINATIIWSVIYTIYGKLKEKISNG